MELFVHNIPPNQKSSKVHAAIKRAVREALREEIPFEWSRFHKNKALAKLTLPTWDIGLRFLAHYRIRGFRTLGANICFGISKTKPNDRLVESLVAKMDAMLQTPGDPHQPDAVPLHMFLNREPDPATVLREIPFKSFEWGVWTTDGQFACCGTSPQTGYITYNPEIAAVEIQGLLARDGYSESGITVDNIIIREIVVDRRLSNPRLYFTLDRIPRFWSEYSEQNTCTESVDEEYYDLGLGSIFYEERPHYRLPGLSFQHSTDAPFCTVYGFEYNSLWPQFERALQVLFKELGRADTDEISTEITKVNLNFTEELKRLDALYEQFEYRIAFQLESLVRNCLLLPHEVSSLDEQVRELVDTYEANTTVRFFQTFASQLPCRTFEQSSLEIDYSKRLRNAVESRISWQQFRVDPNAAWIHRLDITPAAYNMDGPELMGSNRFLRLFPRHHDYFLKVSLVEEDLRMIYQSRDSDIRSILKRWGRFFSNQVGGGIKIAGRHFDFLGFSTSSLREHSVWFLAPFEDGGEIITAESLRSRLGDFKGIRCPPRYAARLGQTFTTTSHSLELSTYEVSHMPDVKRGSYVFSDGVGTISQSMLDRIWKATGTDDDQLKPVVYQIRLGGSKGVVSLDRTLSGHQVCLRPSMTKFPASNTHLELANKGRTLPFFLNKQLIVILETLGLPPPNFITLLDLEVHRLETASRDFDEGLRLCQNYGLGQASKLPKILTTLRKEGAIGIFDMPFFQILISLALSHALKQIKYKSRIAVENSWVLMGVMDEFEILGADEIYVCLKGERDGNIKVLEGDTIITRMPALHCGDVQKVRAIGPLNSANPLSALYNCIVFSSKGKRPLPNMLAGGDLDGDLFHVSQNPLLFPPEWETPAWYPSVTPLDLERECTIQDIADFFLEFIVNDRLGQICSMHSVRADQTEEGVRHPDCVKLSELASVAVDFPKTGIAVNMRNAPWVNTRPKPDFMSQQPIYEKHQNEEHPHPDTALYYRSQKVLGEMYRRVDIPKLLKDWNVNSGWNTDGPWEIWGEIEENLNRIKPSYRATWKDYVDEARELFEMYMEELDTIRWNYHPLPWKGRSLTEHEVFLQCIMMDTSKKSVRGRGRSDYLHGLRQEYNTLLELVRSEILKTEEGRFQRAAACFYVGLDLSRKRKGKEGESFAWIVVPDMYEAWRRVKGNGFWDGEPVKVNEYPVYDSGKGISKFPKEDGVDDTVREMMRNFGVMNI